MTHKCSICGITEEEFYKIHPKKNIYVMGFNPLESFYSNGENIFWCGPCYKEKQLKEVFDLMDKRDKRR